MAKSTEFQSNLPDDLSGTNESLSIPAIAESSAEPESRSSGQTPRPRNYASRASQYRLMVYVSALMLVLWLMNEAGKAKNWEWMWKFQDREVPAQPHQQEPVDTRLAQYSDANHLNSKNSGAKSQAASPSDAFVSRSVPNLETLELANGQVNPQLLEVINDDTYFRADEHVAWFHLLGILKSTPVDQIQQRSIGKLGYNQLFQQTAEYRGKVVEVNGTVRRAHILRAAKNNLGIERYWQLFVSLNDGSRSPVVIYSLRMPDEFPEGMDIREDAVFFGFCYKRWAYQASDAPRLAPVILTNSGFWSRKPIVVDKLDSSMPVSLAAIVAGVAGLGIAIAIFFSARWKSVRSIDRQRKQVAQVQQNLADTDVPTVQDQLRQLEVQEPDDA